MNCIQKIDFLISPQGDLFHELKKVVEIYWNNKDTKVLVEINNSIKEALENLATLPKEVVMKSMYQSNATFSANLPANISKVLEVISNCQANMLWYKENNLVPWANEIMEYSLSNAEFFNSMPSIFTELTLLFFRIR